MKIRGHILAVIDDGEYLKVEAQGVEASAGCLYGLKRFDFHVRTIHANRRALYVGRELTVEIKVGRR